MPGYEPFLLCDFHVHTQWSDGRLTVAEIVDLYVTSLKHYPYVANSDFHKAKHLYLWKTLLRCEKTWPAIADALRKNVDVALTLYRNGSWAA